MKYEIIFVIFSFIYNNFIPMVGQSINYLISYDKTTQNIITTTIGSITDTAIKKRDESSEDEILDGVLNGLKIGLQKNMRPTASAVGSFLVASYTVPLMTNELGTHELVKKATQIIPHQSHNFLAENGNRILASAIGYTTHTAVDEGRKGLNTKNAISFCECAVGDMRYVFTKQYLINPISNYLCGEENGLRKMPLNVLINFGVRRYFVNPIANSFLGKEDSIRKECLKLAITAGAAAALNQAMQKIT